MNLTLSNTEIWFLTTSHVVIHNTYGIISYVLKRKGSFLYFLVFISVTSLTTGNLQRDHCTLPTTDRDDTMMTLLEIRKSF